MIKKLFTIIMVLFPIINIYGSPILTLSIADVLLLIIIGIVIIDLRRKKNSIISIDKKMGIIFLYMIVQLIFIFIFESTEYISKILMPTIRLLVYFGVLTFFSKSYFDLSIGLRILKKVAIVVCCFLFIQILSFNILHIYIPGTIPGLRISEDLQKYNEAKNTGNTARFRSVFNEPAHFSTYVALALGIEILTTKKNKDKKAIAIMTIGLLLSGSSTGILMTAIIYLIFLGKSLRHFTKQTIMKIILLFAILIIVLPIYMQTNEFQIFYSRTIETDSAGTGRMGHYDVIFEDTNNVNFFFGKGILKIEQYIPAFPRIYVYYGILGIIFFVIITIYNFIKLKEEQWIAWTVLFILMFPTELFFGNFVLFYIPFVQSTKKRLLEQNQYEKGD